MEKEIICGIYKITNPIGQIYIGCSKNIPNRWKGHRYTYYSKIGQSILLHGHDNHLFEIIESCIKDDLFERERYWQIKLNSCSDFNLTSQLTNNTVYVNGKRQRGFLTRSTYYLDINTGVYYDSISEISEIYGIKGCTLRNRINGYRGNKNKTQWKAV